MALGVIASLIVPLESASAKKKVIRRSFTATAVPARSPSLYGAFGDCLNQEGVDRVSERFTAPFDGSLTASISPGGWHVSIRQVTEDNRMSYSMAGSDNTTFPVDLERGQRVDVVACNYSGTPSAEVEYVFSAKTLKPPPPARPMTFTDEGWYSAPLMGTVAPIRYEFACFTGCVEFEPWGAHRYITALELDDQASDEVSFIVYQGSTITGSYQERYYCTKLDGPIPLVPHANYVGISPVIGPCLDGTPAFATTGTVSITFSTTPR